MKKFTKEKLSENNGENGKPIYVAYKGKVYDVSESKMWKGGSHMKRHKAGADLTTDIQAAPHEPDVLDRMEQVGVLAEEDGSDEMPMPEFLSGLIDRYPMLRRHPHPMTVHFPIVFMFSATLFSILYLVSGVVSFETTAFHCLAAGVLFTAVAVATGWYTWWLNYQAKPLKAVKIKKTVSIAMLAIAFVALIIRLAVPTILTDFTALSFFYLLLVLAMFPMVVVIGWYGASLTFPIEKE